MDSKEKCTTSWNTDRHSPGQGLLDGLQYSPIPGYSRKVYLSPYTASMNLAVGAWSHSIAGEFCPAQQAVDTFPSMTFEGPLISCNRGVRSASPTFSGVSVEHQVVDEIYSGI